MLNDFSKGHSRMEGIRLHLTCLISESTVHHYSVLCLLITKLQLLMWMLGQQQGVIAFCGLSYLSQWLAYSVADQHS